MCNLYDLGRPRSRTRDDWEVALERALGESAERSPKRFGIRKTDPGIVLLRSGTDDLSGAVMRWGFERSFNPAVNNARSDKLDGMWSEAWENRRRCLIPISTFYEWTGSTGNKQTYAFRNGENHENLLWAAGIWERGESGDAYSMLTTNSSGPTAEIHHRMPVLLPQSAREEYLDTSDPRQLLVPFEGNLEIFRCLNPLRNPTDHVGPVADDFLPGF